VEFILNCRGCYSPVVWSCVSEAGVFLLYVLVTVDWLFHLTLLMRLTPHQELCDRKHRAGPVSVKDVSLGSSDVAARA
jgi:hypothetical protein